jgi:hypothetical protein
MSKLARTVILGVALVAMNLAGMTAIAQAYTSDDPASTRHRALGQLELLTAEDAVASQEQPTIADDARRPPTEAQVGESWRHPANAPVQPAEPSGQPGWLVLGLGVLAAALALAGGLAVTTTRRARRRMRAGQVA